MGALAIASAVFADQLTKALARGLLPRTPGGGVAGPLLAWCDAPLRGPARIGLTPSLCLLLAVGAGAAIVVSSAGGVPGWAAAGGLAAWGAALSNLLDLGRRGAVIDFVMYLPRTRGNLADLTIVFGLALLLAGLAT